MKIMKILKIIFFLALTLVITVSCSDKFIDNYSNIEADNSDSQVAWKDTEFYRGMSEFSYEESNAVSDLIKINSDYSYIIHKYPENNDYLQININAVPHFYDKKNNTFIGCCIDPLCEHYTSACPFSGSIDGCILYDNKMFITKQGFSLNSERKKLLGINENYDKLYCYYDMDKKETVFLRGASYGRCILHQVYYDNYCYYYDVLPDENPEVWSVNFLRQNISTKEIEVLDTINGYTNTVFLAKDGKLYFHDYDFDQLYYTTTDDVTKKEILLNSDANKFMYDDEYLYFIESYFEEKKLSRIRFDGSGYETLGLSNVYLYYIVNDDIYYMDNSQTIASENESGVRKISSRNIFKYNMTTGEQETVITLDGGLAAVDIWDFIIDGNYMYAQFGVADDELGGEVGGYLGILRININDGSYYYISPDSK